MFKNRSDQKYNDLNESFQRMAYIAEIHEWDNRRHLERMRRYTLEVAGALGLSHEEAVTLSLAIQLHDVGKVMTPLELLKRTGNYTTEEWQTIEEHTLQGARILESDNSLVLKTAAAIALTHHERWDGSGYPNHLKGEAIPLSGSLCAVLDVFDALTTKRSYKEVISDEEALRLIKENSGVLFDARVVTAFEKTFLEIRKVKNTLDQ